MTYTARSNDFALFSHDILKFSGFIPVGFALKEDFYFYLQGAIQASYAVL